MERIACPLETNTTLPDDPLAATGIAGVWKYTSYNDLIFCMACRAGIPYQASNLKFRIEKHITSGKHEKKASQRVRQMTLVFTAQENELLRELATALVMETIPLSKVQGKFLKLFIGIFIGITMDR